MPKTKYDHLSREELITVLVKRDSERKLGLVWERNLAEHEKALNSDFVALDLIPEFSCGTAPYRNMVIEGDNFDALRYLATAYRGKVKCMYIAPPSNTGNNAMMLYWENETRWMVVEYDSVQDKNVPDRVWKANLMVGW